MESSFSRVPGQETRGPVGDLAHAILDRLAERAEVFHLEGKSYLETHRRPAPKAPPP